MIWFATTRPVIPEGKYKNFRFVGSDSASRLHRAFLINPSLIISQVLTAYHYRNRDKWLIIGEWSGAMTDCAPYLNGYFQGSRYDQTFKDLNNATAETIFVGSCQGKSGNISTWSSTYKKQVKTYIATQIQVFEAQADGWTFWNFKTEGNGASEWDALALVDAGLFPTLKNRTAVTGGQICK